MASLDISTSPLSLAKPSHGLPSSSIAYKNKFYCIKYKSDPDFLQARTNYPPLGFTDIVHEPAIYTWIVGKTKGGELRFWAKKCINQFEISTKHQEILYDVSCINDQKVEAANETECINEFRCAGELSIRPGTSWFNFSSGTFMTDAIDTEFEPEKQFIIGQLKAVGIHAEFTEDTDTFINLVTGLELIHQLNDTGIIDFYRFDTKDEVDKFKSIDTNIAKLEAQIAQDNRNKYFKEEDKKPNLDALANLIRFKEECRNKIVDVSTLSGGRKTRRKRKSRRKRTRRF